MEIEKTGSGIFQIDVSDGQIILRKISSKDLDEIKENGIGTWSNNKYFLSGGYHIEGGVLYAHGEVSSTTGIWSGDFSNDDFDDQSKIDEMIDTYFIDNSRIYTSIFKFWFKQSTKKRYIKQGRYLSKKSIERTYKTSSFRVIE